jgi:type III restriction enzyme
VKTTDGTVWIVETKGRSELDLPQKMARLRQWCADATSASQAEGGPAYRFVYVDAARLRAQPAKEFRRADPDVPGLPELRDGSHLLHSR